MVPNMRVIGAETRLTARVNSGMQMETSMRVNGKRIKPTVMEFIRMLTGPSTRATGGMTFRMALAWSRGPTDHATRVATRRA